MATETFPQAQSTTPVPPRGILMDVLAAGLQAHPELSVRLDKAASIVESGGVQRHTGATVGAWWVRSQSCDREYFVTLADRYQFDRCTCPDSQQRGTPCKHSLSVRLLLACERRAARLQAATERHVEPAPACAPPSVDPAAPIPYVLTAKAEAALDQAAATVSPLPAA